MKRILATFLCFVMVITLFSFNLTTASTIIAFSEDFEGYNNGDSITSGAATSWKVYDEGENGYWKTTAVSSDGWFYNNNGNISVTNENHSAATGSQNSVFVPGWVTLAKEIELSPNTDYTLSFNFFTDVRTDMDISVLDATNANGYSFKAYTSFSPISTAN